MAALEEAEKVELVLKASPAKTNLHVRYAVGKEDGKIICFCAGCKVARGDRQPNLSTPLRMAKKLSLRRVSCNSSGGASLLMAATAAESR